MRIPCTPLLLSLALPMLACAPDEVRPDDVGDDVSSAGSETDSDTGTMAGMVPARGNIALSKVVINQGVDVPIADENGEWVGAEGRNTFIAGNRDTLIRGFWEYPDDWVPRNITARLLLEYPDGTSRTLEDPKMISMASYPGDINRSFLFTIAAQDFVPGIKFQMSLWEGDETGFEDIPESSTVIQSPIDGPQPIGIQTEPLELKVVFVPVVYNAGSCQTDTSTITDAEEKNFIDYLHEENPTQEVIWEFRRGSPIQRNTALSSLSQLHLPLQDLRIQDGAGPNVYYYALVDVCGPGIDGAAGIAAGIPPATMEAGAARVAAGVWLPNQKKYSYHTFVHEIGHCQGLSHIYCNGGGSVGNDPEYPYENGIINVWGFGIRLYEFHSPTATYDYMTYCQPNWASDWTWTKVFNRINTLTSWDYAGKPMPAPAGELLYGLLMPDGTEQWWTTPGGRESEFFSGAASVRFDFGDEQFDIPAALELLEDGTRRIVAPLPRPARDLTAVTRLDSQGVAHAVTLTRRLTVD